jgi:hypothetical protein
MELVSGLDYINDHEHNHICVSKVIMYGGIMH